MLDWINGGHGIKTMAFVLIGGKSLKQKTVLVINRGRNVQTVRKAVKSFRAMAI